MLISELSDQALEETLKTERERNEILRTLEGYAGDDRMVLVQEAVKASKVLQEKVYYPMGLPTLDKMIGGGFKAGELVIVSGPTGHGKTAFCQSMTKSLSPATPCAWFSYEVGVEDLMERFGAEVPEFYVPMKISGSRMNWTSERIWEAVAKYDTKVVFLDHLHYLLDMNALAKMNTSLAIGSLMRELKMLALKTRTVIVLVSHLTKTKVEDAPDIDDLRDSSFVGQESDFVILVWRDKNKTTWEYEDSYIRLGKNRRRGTLGAVTVTLRDGRFYESYEV